MNIEFITLKVFGYFHFADFSLLIPEMVLLLVEIVPAVFSFGTVILERF